MEDDFGDLILPIPYEVCYEELGWDVGCELDYEVNGDSFIIKKVKKDE